MVTRFDFQKGVDIALNALRMVTAQPWQAILLGTGNASLEEAARLLEAHFPTAWPPSSASMPALAPDLRRGGCAAHATRATNRAAWRR